MIAAFTGHRPDKLGGYLPNEEQFSIYESLVRILKELKPDYGVSGMALGVDTLAAQACLDLDIPLIAAVPFSNQSHVWRESQTKHYKDLLEKSFHVVNVSGLAWYSPEHMQKRNEFMVDICDVLIAVWDGSSGGTGNCVKYAESKNKSIWRVNKYVEWK